LKIKELKYYLGLAAALAIGLALFLLFDYHRQVQILIVFAMGVVYVLWGIIYHQAKNQLHFRLVLEYVAIAVIACLSVVFLLLRA